MRNFKAFKKISILIFMLSIVIAAGAHTESAEAATTGYTEHGHSWYPEGKNDDCNGTKCNGGKTYVAANTSTTCSKCVGAKKITCTTCAGKKYTISTSGSDEYYYGCTKCGGSGYDWTEGSSGEYIEHSLVEGSGKITCTKCYGTGKYGTCSLCNGTGVNYYCTNDSCMQGYTGWDNWETESGYNPVCYETENTLTIQYYTNYPNGSNTLAYTWEVPYTLGTDNHYNYTSINISYTGYTGTGYWGSSTTGGSLWHEDTNWNTTEEIANFYGTSIKTESKTIKVYAQWEPTGYSVTYDANGGTGAPNKQGFAYGSGDALSTTIPTKPGYTFVNWVATHDTSYTFDPGDSIPTNWGSFTLKAQWKANTYQIQFNANGGTGTMQPMNVTYGVSNSLTANAFSKTGYTFNGWHCYSSAADKWLYYNGSSTAYYTEGEEPDGWEIYTYIDKQGFGGISNIANDTVIMYAQWTPKKYTLTINPNYSGAAISTKTVEYGKAYRYYLSTPTREGYDFVGWYTSTASTATKIELTDLINTAANHTVYGRWKVRSHNVTYDVNGGQNLSITGNQITHDYGSPIDLTPTATKPGYTFVGWSYDKEGQCIQNGTMPDEDVTLYAQYTLPVSGLKKAELVLWDSSVSVSLPIPETDKRLDGSTYAVNGLNTLLTFTGDTSAFGAKVVVYDYAGNSSEWELNVGNIPSPTPPYIPKDYKQSVKHFFYHVANETTDLKYTIEQMITEGEKYAPMLLPATINGTAYTMPAGYASSYSITNSYGNVGEYTVTESAETQIVYQPNFYTLKFDANGGAFEDGKSTNEKEVQYTAYYGQLPTPEREGYDFTGWYTANGGSIGTVAGTQVNSSNVFETAGNVTLYAGWKAKTFYLRYDWTTNGGTSALSVPATNPVKIEYGTLVNISATASKPGFHFYGWSKDNVNSKNGSDVVSSFYMPAKDVTLYAQFDKSITLKFHDESGVKTVSGTYWNNETSVNLNIPAITPFENWIPINWKAADGSVYGPDGGSLPAEESKEFYAYYQKDVKAEFIVPEDMPPIDTVKDTLYYNTGGTQTNITVKLPVPPNRNGYSFIGWESSDGQTFDYKDKPASGNWTGTFRDSTAITGKWDKFPTLQVYDRYFTLEDAVTGKITTDELLLSASALDEEDGVIGKNNGLSIIDYNAEEFKNLTSSATVTVTFQAKDSFGNTVTKTAVIHVVNTTARDTDVSKEARFIENRYLFTADSLKDEDGDGYLDGKGNTKNYGGLRATSLWKTNSLYISSLNKAMLNNNTPVMSYTFTKTELDDMKEYVETNGFADFLSDLGRINFIDLFFN